MITSVIVGTIALAGSASALSASQVNMGNNAAGAVNTYHNFNASVESGDAVNGSTLNEIKLDYGVDKDFNGSTSNVTQSDVNVTLDVSGGVMNKDVTQNISSVSADGDTVTVTMDDTIQLNTSTTVTLNASNVTNPSTDETYLAEMTLNGASSDGAEYVIGSLDTRQAVTSSSSNVTTADANIRLNFTDDVGVNESKISVWVTNNQTGVQTQLVDNGSTVNAATAVDPSNFTDGNNNDTETVSVNVPLQEGDYNITANATDLNGNDFSASFQDNFTVDMGGKSLNIVPDDTGPPAGSNANISIVALDQNDNELLFNDSNVNATMADITMSFSDPDNTTFNNQTSGNDVPINYSATGYNLTHKVNYTQVGNLTITAQDFGGNLTSGSAVQTYTAEIKSVNVSAADGELTADGSDTETITLQLLDQNGNPVKRSGVTVQFGIVSGNKDAAGVSVNASSTTTNTSGIATITYNATEAGYTIEVSGKTTSLDTQRSDDASFDTVAGQINNSNSDLQLDGESDTLTGQKVATEHTLVVDIRDSQDNAIMNVDVTVSSNVSNVSFASTSLSTNSSGQASTTVTLPETKGGVAINATANGFNASATGNAQVNVSTIAENATALRFGSDSRNLATQTSSTVTVEVVDEFGNINTSAQPDVTLETSDTGTIEVNGAKNHTKTASSGGNVSFSIDANATSGSATLTASSQNQTNVSDTWDIGTPAQIELTFGSNVTTSNRQGAMSTTTLFAQLQDANGNDLQIGGENVTFAISSGDAAELDQRNSSQGFSINTNASGVATIQINATDNTGQTSIFAQSANYTKADGEANITTTGTATKIRVSVEDASPRVNTSTNVTVSFRDDQSRNVPRTQDVTVKTSLSGSFFESNDAQSVSVTIEQQSGGAFSGSATLNSTASGDTTVRAIGGGVTGTAAVSFQAPLEGEGSVTFNNQTVTNGTTSVEVASANATVEFYVNVSDSNGTVLGTTSTFIADTEHTNFSVNLDSALTANQTLTASLHNASNDTDLASDDASITVEPEDTTAPTADAGANQTVNVSVDFELNASGSSDDVGITSYEWDVDGDGTTDLTGETVTHNYSSAGNNTVTLTVTDAAGNNDTDTVTITVEAAQNVTLPGFDNPASSTDDDPQLEDTNGNGGLDIGDVQALFAHRQSDPVQNNVDKFDFNNNDQIDIGDVQALYQEFQNS